VGCQIPYRCIVPAGLDNVWIASRCLGVTQDAGYSIRMERDIQRAGEAAGYAAALAVQHGVDARDVPFPELKAALDATGALELDMADPTFSRHLDPEALEPPPDRHELIEESLVRLDEGKAGKHLAHLYFLGHDAPDRVRQRLDSDDDRVSWFAAGICAMWGDQSAEPRLLEALRNGEWGYDELDRDLPPLGGKDGWIPNPMDVPLMAPNWLTAVRLLGLCGTERTLETLEGFAADADHSLDTRIAIGLAVELLAKREQADVDRAASLLKSLTESEIPGRLSFPKRQVPALAEQARRDGDVEETRVKHGGRPSQEPEDHIWQLHVVIARTRIALGLAPQDEAREFLEDERAYVRRAFSEVLGKS
jgi:hypothetical protein